MDAPASVDVKVLEEDLKIKVINEEKN